MQFSYKSDSYLTMHKCLNSVYVRYFDKHWMKYFKGWTGT